MYHYITLGDLKIYLTGIGIVLFLGTFLISLRHYCRRYQLPFAQFFRTVPHSILIIYLLATYSRYLVESFIVFPTDPQQRLLYLTPKGYTFHFLWILIGVLVCIHWFFKHHVAKGEQRQQWLEAFFHSLMRAIIPLGICLLMGENFIGKQIDWWIYVSAIRNDSAVAVYDKVIPLGLYLSILWLAWHFFAIFLEHKFAKKNMQSWGYLAFSAFSFALSILLLRQQYPRHLVMQIGGTSIDMKQYLLWICAAFFLYKYKKYQQQRRLYATPQAQ